MLREILNLKSIESNQVLSLKDVVFVEKSDKKDVVMVFKYFEYDLFGIARRGRKWSLYEVRELMRQILIGVRDMHN